MAGLFFFSKYPWCRHRHQCAFERGKDLYTLGGSIKSFEFFNLWKIFCDKQFEIIIDDGLHTFKTGISTFENSFHKLKPNGIYVIEDVRNSSPADCLNYFKDR